MMIDPQWIIAISSTVSSLAILCAVWQISLSRKKLAVAEDSLVVISKQLQVAQNAYIDSHELERRKQSIKLLKEWTNFLSAHGTAAKGFCAELDVVQCEAIVNEKPLIVDERFKGYLERNIPGVGHVSKSEKCGEREIYIDASQSAIIRKRCASYLNLLEVILSAAQNGIADKDMIKDQLEGLVTSNPDYPIVHNFRKAIGGYDAFPAISIFIDEVLEQKREKAGKGQLAVVK